MLLHPGAWLVVLAIAAGVAVPSALASPGGLDSRGGHHCRKSASYCAKYGLRLNQYHCHRAPCNAKDLARATAGTGTDVRVLTAPAAARPRVELPGRRRRESCDRRRRARDRPGAPNVAVGEGPTARWLCQTVSADLTAARSYDLAIEVTDAAGDVGRSAPIAVTGSQAARAWRIQVADAWGVDRWTRLAAATGRGEGELRAAAPAVVGHPIR